MILNNLFLLCAGAYPEQYGSYANLQARRRHLQLTLKYVDLHCNRFDYKNLPEDFKAMTGKNKLFENMLYFAPAIAFFKDEALGLQALPVQGNWEFDIAGYPTKWEVFGANGYRKKLNDTNSVIMFNDYSFTIPFVDNIYDIDNMIECDLTHKQNLKAQRQPLLMELEEDEKKSAQQFLSKLTGFDDVIKVRVRHGKDDKNKLGKNPYDTKTFESGRSFEGDKLGSDYRYFENRIYTRLGYNNENLEKKERMLVDEVNGNNDIINSFYTSALDCRKEAIEKVNKMFGTNIEVVPKLMKTVKEENENDNVSALSEKPPVERRPVSE